MVFDIGANAGYYSMLYATRSARVVAVEPVPLNVEHLREHIRLNGLNDRVAIVEAAVVRASADSVGFVTDESGFMGRVGVGTMRVRATTMMELVETHGVPDLIKMDIEGGEFDALSGGRELLTMPRRPTIFIATHSDQLTNDVQMFLTELDYSVLSIEGGPVEPRSREVVAVPT